MEQLTANPGIFGLIIGAIGALVMVGAILKWRWIVGDSAAGNTVRTGLFGYIVYKLFGRRVFYIITGAVILLAGLAWFAIYTFFM